MPELDHHEQVLANWAAALTDERLANDLTTLVRDIRHWNADERAALIAEAAKRVQRPVLTKDEREAKRWVANHLEAIETGHDEAIGDGSGTYADVVGRKARYEAYMVAGGGPTGYYYFIFDEDGDVDHAYLQLTGWPETVYEPVPQYKTQILLDACRRDKAIRNSHGA